MEHLLRSLTVQVFLLVLDLTQFLPVEPKPHWCNYHWGTYEMQTIEKATVSDSIFNGYNLFNNTVIFAGFVGVNSSLLRHLSLQMQPLQHLPQQMQSSLIFSSTNNLFTDATTTNSYISSLIASSFYTY